MKHVFGKNATAAVSVAGLVKNFGQTLALLPERIQKISPFTYQKAPALEVSMVAIVAMLAVLVTFGVAGLAAFRQRDIVPG